MNIRKGLTLLEMIVVVAILAILIALLIPALQRVRETSARAHSQNNLKQLALAVHQFATTHRDRLPSIDGNRSSANYGRSLFEAILPVVQGGAQPNLGAEKHGSKGARQTKPRPLVPMFVSPLDPTFDPRKRQDVSSYAANAQAFQGNPRLPGTFQDGVSNTIAFAERYSSDCQGIAFLYSIGHTGVRVATPTTRRATFADDYYGDTRPGSSFARTFTFQMAPRSNKCSYDVPQTPHPGGMLVALSDGSGRIISPSVSANTFWGAVSPAGGELLGSDW